MSSAAGWAGHRAHANVELRALRPDLPRNRPRQRIIAEVVGHAAETVLPGALCSAPSVTSASARCKDLVEPHPDSAAELHVAGGPNADPSARALGKPQLSDIQAHLDAIARTRVASLKEVFRESRFVGDVAETVILPESGLRERCEGEIDSSGGITSNSAPVDHPVLGSVVFFHVSGVAEAAYDLAAFVDNLHESGGGERRDG